MTGITNDIERRHEPRYRIVPEHTVEVLVQRSSEESDETVPGELLDLSPGGVQVCLPTYLQFLEVVGVRIVVPEASVNIDATAEVCWIRPTDDNKCLVGCSFTLRISEAVVERMAEAGFIDRRRHPRHVTSICGVARRELNADEFPIRITDYSEGGFRMVSERPCTVGSTVSVEVDSPEDDFPPLSAKVCWQEEQDGQYFLGCSLKRLSDFQRLHDLCREKHEAEPQTARTKELLFLAATWLFLFIGSTLLGLMAIDAWRGPQTLPPDGNYRPVLFNRPAEDPTEDLPAENPTAEDRPSDGRSAVKQTETSGTATGGRDSETAEGSPADPPDDSHALETGPVSTPPKPSNSTSGTSESQNVPAPVRRSPPSPSSPLGSMVDTFPDPGLPNQPGSVDRHGSVDRQESAKGSAAGTAPPVNAGTPQDSETDPLPTTSPAEAQRPVDPEKATEALIEGDKFYRDQQFDEAVSAFRTAAEHDPQNALPYYLLAMAHYQLSQFREAETAVRKAIRLEQEHPIEHWGSRLSRYQGRPRLWVEQQRSSLARATRD